ncbi:MucR family transcriptional regulator [Neomegalonema perideroedes]|uniref:MucR family transcriptional regulator n=1 Tax=Neomegalonema perideroedes TaxID=217219 RepID=UPI0003639F60|nr:MucR family transcriptional regulator [Neomegalonema perideroedes]
MTEAALSRSETLELTAEIVAAHVANNSVPIADLPTLIQSVFHTLANLGEESVVLVEEIQEELKPAVPVKKSVTPDYIICLEDGKKLKMLKRHLKTAYNMTPDDYRARWGLPADYPMVAPNYALKRQELAKRIGLGRHRGKADEE